LVEAPCTSLYEWLFDYFSFVMQQLKGRKERLLVSRNSVFVLMLPSAFVHRLSQPQYPGDTRVCDVVMMRFAL
jgi:hypothetical protein